MTIFQPHEKRTSLFTRSFILLVLGILTLALISIYLNISVVEARHLVKKLESRLQDLEAANAELKNNLYQIISSENLKRAAKELSLIKENDPEFLETIWAFASQY